MFKYKTDKWFPSVPSLCDMCQSNLRPSLLHYYMMFPKVQMYWCILFHIITEILDSIIDPEPQTIILTPQKY